MKIKTCVKPLSVNRAWQGNLFRSKDYLQYTNDLLLTLPKGRAPEGKLLVVYRFHIKNHKLADWDNPIKPLQDVLVRAGILPDDRFIYQSIVEKVPDEEEYAEIYIFPCPQESLSALLGYN